VNQTDIDRQIPWLLQSSDPALLHQIHKDLLDAPCHTYSDLRQAMTEKGQVKQLLQERHSNGGWGNSVYNPKWTCTHYVLYELTQLEAPQDLEILRESTQILVDQPVGIDGGINYAKTIPYSDVCINGMILTIACYFGIDRKLLLPIVEYLMNTIMPDGGWNCVYHLGAIHSSLHTTISVLEGLLAYQAYSGQQEPKITKAIQDGIEFILLHQLYLSDHTGEVIKDEFCTFPFPIRWKYDILRCLDLFQKHRIAFDTRMNNALDQIESKSLASGRWRAASQPGKTYFTLEKNGKESRWNTLRALRVLKHYRLEG
jgi:hypothetical protein